MRNMLCVSSERAGIHMHLLRDEHGSSSEVLRDLHVFDGEFWNGVVDRDELLGHLLHEAVPVFLRLAEGGVVDCMQRREVSAAASG